MSRDVITFLEDILTAIDDIVAFTAALDFEAFKQDRKTIYAVTRALEIMGEATKTSPTMYARLTRKSPGDKLPACVIS